MAKRYGTNVGTNEMLQYFNGTFFLFLECDRSVVVHKGEKGFGFHIHGSHPAIVTTVEPGKFFV